MFGNGPTENNIQPPDENRYFELKTAELAVPNLPVTALFHDLRALTGLARELPPGNVTEETALYVANKIVNTYRPRDPASVEAARALAASVLARRDPADRMQVYAVGHCHIDTAWLWPFSETHRKTARSWSAQLRLAERFPWHIFTASSAQQYEWLLTDYPGLFAEIQAAAAKPVTACTTWCPDGQQDGQRPWAQMLQQQAQRVGPSAPSGATGSPAPPS
ncbi:Alpha-mannosidase [Tetrabaena socialis]|uniref:Alpha-mannosidase n=1 Tax=Tetrabaena socialis TaxID=47790 RepID=A0A2J8AGD4_9CHLO|nr:Alpha-mannosidase [Tetrabaena socialis]|eukprot:PNH11583.1 Alpha-mannosidase [Tetrabaena socialis]